MLAASASVTVTQANGEPLAGAVFYAVRLDGPAPAHDPGPAVMDQLDRRFVPHVLPIEAGTEVRFTNSDSISHHVYSFSPSKRFELYLAKEEVASPGAFDRAGVVALGCNIHDWMLAYVLVVDTPHFVRTSDEGKGVLADLPAGRYRLALWHPRMGGEESIEEHEVTLGRSDGAEWPLRLEERLLPSRTQEPGFVEY